MASISTGSSLLRRAKITAFQTIAASSSPINTALATWPPMRLRVATFFSIFSSSPVFLNMTGLMWPRVE